MSMKEAYYRVYIQKLIIYCYNCYNKTHQYMSFVDILRHHAQQNMQNITYTLHHWQIQVVA